jgi:hypothetical protein
MQITKKRPLRISQWAIRLGFVLVVFLVLTLQLNILKQNNHPNSSNPTKGIYDDVGHLIIPNDEARISERLAHTRLEGQRLHHAQTQTAAVSTSTSTSTMHTSKEQQLRDCQVLIINQHVEYHYEVLESVLALYPLPEIPTCNHKKLQFTASISSGANPHYRRKSDSWYDYAKQNIMPRNYFGIVTPGQSRRLTNVIQTMVLPLNNDTDINYHFDYQISASCYCGDAAWIFQDQSHFCVCHVSCRRDYFREKAPNRIKWLHPKFGKTDSFLPSYLPRFDEIERPLDREKHHLCVIGHVLRRQYSFVATYLSEKAKESNNNSTANNNIALHHFGWGDVPESMTEYASLIQFHGIPDFVPWQKDLYSTCDAILSLLSKQNQTEYFDGKTKLSGALVQAVAYRKPILLHEDLAAMYSEHLVTNIVEPHTDDPVSFGLAMDRLLQRLTDLKKEESKQ